MSSNDHEKVSVEEGSCDSLGEVLDELIWLISRFFDDKVDSLSRAFGCKVSRTELNIIKKHCTEE